MNISKKIIKNIIILIFFCLKSINLIVDIIKNNVEGIQLSGLISIVAIVPINNIIKIIKSYFFFILRLKCEILNL